MQKKKPIRRTLPTKAKVSPIRPKPIPHNPHEPVAVDMPGNSYALFAAMVCLAIVGLTIFIAISGI